ncbi:MAG: hypothetical protein H7338_24430 [Candidatus Sericytochromatia bacterium]|nr:hypothetical protein [Candidatus Sericytochromatia bacterium]
MSTRNPCKKACTFSNCIAKEPSASGNGAPLIKALTAWTRLGLTANPLSMRTTAASTCSGVFTPPVNKPFLTTETVWALKDWP